MIKDVTDLNIGDKVHYTSNGKIENGMIKEFSATYRKQHQSSISLC